MQPVIGTLSIINVAVFLLEGLADDSVVSQLALWPAYAGFMPWQLLTYAFLHGSVTHLGLNIYGLWMFGSDLERLLGTRHFVALYFMSVFCAGVTQLIVATISGDTYPTVGASGGVFGVLLGFALFFPRRIIILIFPPVALPARLFVSLYGGLELLLGVTGTAAGIAHFAHLGGMVGGYLVLRGVRKSKP